MQSIDSINIPGQTVKEDICLSKRIALERCRAEFRLPGYNPKYLPKDGLIIGQRMATGGGPGSCPTPDPVKLEKAVKDAQARAAAEELVKGTAGAKPTR